VAFVVAVVKQNWMDDYLCAGHNTHTLLSMTWLPYDGASLFKLLSL